MPDLHFFAVHPIPDPFPFMQRADEELIILISNILSDGKPHPAGRIAFTLNVSSKTVRRKLQYMREELKLPIEPTRQGFVFRER